MLFDWVLGLFLLWRIVIVVAMLAPLGIRLGMPFPTGLRIVADEAPAFVPWASMSSFFTSFRFSSYLPRRRRP
jgi:hypothetical protein